MSGGALILLALAIPIGGALLLWVVGRTPFLRNEVSLVTSCGLLAAVAALIFVVLPRQADALNALLLGESEARHLGIAVDRIKRQLVLLTAAGVGVSVAVAGAITFVGLVVPHIVRMLIGPDHRWLLPASALAGAILLLVADTLARVVVAPTELPVGLLTALLGAPFFISLLRRRREYGL